MALSRRNSNRFQASIWPGFVDAMTGLLLVMMFVLTIFTVIQFVLREKISGQEDQLNELTAEVQTLTAALGLERDRSTGLASQVGTLTTDLAGANEQIGQANATIAALTAQRDETAAALADAQTRITGFEAQVAGLLAQRADLQDQVAGLETEQTKLLSDAEALNLALAQARTEIDASAEEARLAAARREAIEALLADLEATSDASQVRISELETQQLADAAAAEALREKLANADAELTAMTLALEEQRKQAEETLTLLAAAQAATETLDDELAAALLSQQATDAELAALREAGADKDATRADLEARLATALAAAETAEATAATQLTEAERQAALLAAANTKLAEEEALSAESQRQVAALNANVSELRAQVLELQSLLDIAKEADAEQEVQITNLGADLNQALARAAAENARRLELEEAERKRLEAEAQELANYRSEFFGQIRQVLADQEGVRIEGDRFVFSSEVLFPVGSATLSAQGTQEIAKVAGILRSISDNIPDGIDWIIRVDGHTDNVPLSGNGEFKDNWELSQARALSVVRFMVESEGIDPTHLSANGFGEFQPVDGADTEAARAQNRRIELKLTER